MKVRQHLAAIVCLASVVLSSFVLLGAQASLLVPSPVSPGSVRRTAADQACPTFLWGAVPGARSYELVVYSTTAAGEVAREAEQELAPVLRVSVAGTATGYTPPADSCLERGESYAWVVRAISSRTESAWSEPRLFEVTSGAGDSEEVAELKRAVEELRSRLVEAEERVDALSEGLREPGGTTRAGVRGRAATPRAGRPIGSLPTLTHDTTGPGLVRQHLAANSPDPDLPVSLDVSTGLRFSSASAAHMLWQDDLLMWANGSSVALGRDSLTNITLSQAANTAIGAFAMQNATGSGNVALGEYALRNTTGSFNTAVGFRAGHDLTIHALNTAIGAYAMEHKNGAGYGNVAVGAYAMNALLGGGDNIAIGHKAGYYFDLGSDNIHIGSRGTANDDNVIRIGKDQTHSFLAGDLELGPGNEAAQNRLHVKEAVSGSATPGNHVAQIENTSGEANADVLALKVGRNHVDGSNPIGNGNNFITFFDGDDSVLGQIQGNGTGGIELVSGNADFAEWLPRLDTRETLEPGDVVGLHDGGLSRTTRGAARVFVVSTAPIVTGNDPGEAEQSRNARVAFLGQAPVKVRGPVHAGDLLVASGRDDGFAVARAAKRRSDRDTRHVVGQALETASGDGPHRVRALVGVGVACSSSASH